MDRASEIRNTTSPPAGLSEAAELHRPSRLESLAFETTEELDDDVHFLGQERAAEAVRFGIGMNGNGFNIYALGPEETDKREMVRHFIEDQAQTEPVPDDLCYLNNFENNNEPKAISVSPGRGRELAEVMDRFASELAPTLASVFESEEYQNRVQTETEQTTQDEQEALESLQEETRERNLALLKTPGGFVFAPMKDDEPVPPESLEDLSEEDRERMESDIETMQEKLQTIFHRLPKAKRELRKRIRSLDREMARASVKDLLEEAREAFKDHEKIQKHLDDIEEDVADNLALLRKLGGREGDGEAGGSSMMRELMGQSEEKETEVPGTGISEHPALRRYLVNVAVDHGESGHAPVVYLDHPTYQNLAGTVEYQPYQGALVTDFTLIRPGALHRANGGYLLLDIRNVLLQPFSWEGLKRALQSGELRIESPRQMMGLVSTVSLEPAAVPLEVKVVLLGSRRLFYLLSGMEPDFPELFKVEADFDDEMERSPENEELFARLVAGVVRREELAPFQKDAVGRIIERSARMAGDREKLSVRTRSLLDLIRESAYWAGENGADQVAPEHVQEAIDHSIYRASRIRDRIHEQIQRKSIFIDTEGARVGQVNGLSVLQLGSFAFGRPSRITARVRMGKGEVINIEREVELSGPIHSKGVLILSGFLGGRYAQEHPLSLSASLVFEQSYGGVEGDSASSAELYALLSALSGVPLKQSVAVTGSVNQRGEIQPVGGINEKVEGFFDICEDRGLTGEQGVLLPDANVKHLMLRDDVVRSVETGRFHIWPVKTVDQGMEALTGKIMGARENGRFPEGTLNAAVESRLLELAETMKRFGSGDRESGPHD